MIDLRSDTVTLPCAEMLRAALEAPLGDDVFGEDPSANALESYAKTLLGKEAALFVPTGTMGNLVALLSHCGRGDAALVGDESHVYHYEAGSASVVGGVQLKVVATQPQGQLAISDLDRALSSPSDVHQAADKLVCIETTHARKGGTCLPVAYLRELRDWADAHSLAVHLDGARLFNACSALNCSPSELTSQVTSVQCCLSKGLGAPAGCILAGERSFVERARRWRKLLGGGMRQVGVLAAPGMWGLQHGRGRLAEDHGNAQYLSAELVNVPGVALCVHPAPTNIVLFRIQGLADTEVVQALEGSGVRVSRLGPWVRAVTHRGVDRAQCAEAVQAVRLLAASV